MMLLLIYECDLNAERYMADGPSHNSHCVPANKQMQDIVARLMHDAIRPSVSKNSSANMTINLS